VTQPASFDAARYKETTREQWDAVAEAWNRWGPTLQRWLTPATDAMLEMAQLRPGSRVLDVAGGSGEPALSASAHVGPSGYVLTTDISTNLVRLASENARARGLGEEAFQARVMDGESLDLSEGSFDAVLSRLGLIFFPNRQRAFLEIRRVLREGGRVVVASFTTPQANPFFSIPLETIRRRAKLLPPQPGAPGPFSLGSAEVIEGEYRRAGFREVQTRLVPAPLRFDSADECLRFEQECFGALHQMLEGLSEGDRGAAWEEIGTKLKKFERPIGFESPCELLMGAATK
jgi:ubiquinone/menaquinone biosynthesis C-methylase UbiE